MYGYGVPGLYSGFEGLGVMDGGYGEVFGLNAVGPTHDSLAYDPYATSGSSDSTFVPLGSQSVSETTSFGALRLHVKPDTAAVYVDGNYVGEVNQFNGTFHKLRLDAGSHRVEIRAPGYQPLTFHARIEPDHTENYRGELDKAER